MTYAKTYDVTFTGRPRGERGMRTSCKATVRAETKTHALVAIFQTHELITDVIMIEKENSK
jgi:hypothetical protein